MRASCSGRSIISSARRLMLPRPNAGAVRPPEPLFSFGVIADVQYADIPDGRSFLGVPRYYRHSLAVLRRAVRSWNAHGGVRFCVNFGDIVDGFCPRDRSLAAARRFLEERNPNRDKNSPSGLEGAARRFVMFNGGVGGAQLRWLDAVLRGAAARGEKAVVCSHLPVHPGAASPTGLMWNYEDVAAVVRRHEGCVVACLAGHDHRARLRRGRPRRAPPHAGGGARVPAGHRRLRPRRGVARPPPARRLRQNGHHGDAAQLLLQLTSSSDDEYQIG